ncbi:tRNA (guanine-N(7)-)-methyltransferase, partial [Clarias magur]
MSYYKIFDHGGVAELAPGGNHYRKEFRSRIPRRARVRVRVVTDVEQKRGSRRVSEWIGAEEKCRAKGELVKP